MRAICIRNIYDAISDIKINMIIDLFYGAVHVTTRIINEQQFAHYVQHYSSTGLINNQEL